MTKDSHGTSCAGIIGMGKDNYKCGVGVAYNVKIAGQLNKQSHAKAMNVVQMR